MFTATLIIVAVLALAVVLFLVKRAVGMFVKLVLFGLLLLVLLGGALAWWWYAPTSDSSPRGARPASTRTPQRTR